jgi:two-component system, chemotaxis family, sensor kinase CheA
MDDLLAEFLTETNEALDVTDVELVKLEQEPDNPDILGNIFRLVHTIKGTSGFLGLPRLETVAHAGEDVLGKIRDGEIDVSPDVITLVLEALDRIKEIVQGLGELETEPEGDDSEIVGRLRETAATAKAPAKAAEPAAAASATSEFDDIKANELDALEAAFNDAPGPEDEASAPDPEPESSKEVVAAKTTAVAKKKDPAAAKKAEKSGDSSSANQTIRVSVDLLETLMTTVSELVLTRNQLMQLLRVREGSDSEFTVPLQRLSHVTTDLQEGVMKTRMQPIGNAWAKLPRIVRDLANDLGKKIEIEMIGAETELDRQVLELIKDPLMHMVRNSGDHGLESTEERIAAGKPETGTITLNAFHEGGHIIMRISDDGGGIDIDRVKQKALDNGIATEQELSSLSEQQALQYIFKAGFSTAKAVTSVSGRGVGLDVVRTNVEKIGGTVDAKSIAGQGTTFTIKIPLTLAIVSALIVGCAGERFAMPQISVVELVRASKESEHKIEVINETPVLRLRNRLLPLVDLRTILQLEDIARVEETVLKLDQALAGDTPADDEKAASVDGTDTTPEAETDDKPAVHDPVADAEDSFILVTQVGSYRFGIVVDRVFDTEEIVVKPVAPILRHIGVFSGNTILGDGSVIMILDPNGCFIWPPGRTLFRPLSSHENISRPMWTAHSTSWKRRSGRGSNG